MDTITVTDGGSLAGAGGTGTGGNTDLGAALACLGQALKSPPHPRRAIPPLVVLLSDGVPTDEFEGPLAALDSLGWAQKAQRFAIAIGRDADPEVLTKFTGDRNKVLDANKSERLATLIQWCSTQVLQSSLTAGGGDSGPASFMPPTPPPPAFDFAECWQEAWSPSDEENEQRFREYAEGRWEEGPDVG
jgi:uncharacterized protein YegL